MFGKLPVSSKDLLNGMLIMGSSLKIGTGPEQGDKVLFEKGHRTRQVMKGGCPIPVPLIDQLGCRLQENAHRTAKGCCPMQGRGLKMVVPGIEGTGQLGTEEREFQVGRIPVLAS